MEAEKFAEHFTPVASANNIVMVFPQAAYCWDTSEMFTGDDFLNRDGPHMKFLKSIVTRVTKPRDPKYDFSSKTYEPFSAYTNNEFENRTIKYECKTWVDESDG